MTLISKNVYFNKLSDIVNKYNKSYHSTIKMNPVDVKSSTYIDFNKENNEADPKFEVGDYVRTSKYKNIFAKGYVSNWSEEVCVIKKVKNANPWTNVISDVNGKKNCSNILRKRIEKSKSKRV